MNWWKKVKLFILWIEYGIFNVIFASLFPEFAIMIIGYFLLTSVGMGYIAIKEK